MKTTKCHMSSYLSSHLLSKPSLVICLLNENHMKTNNQCLSSSTCNLEAKPSFNAETRGSSNVILIDYLKGCGDLVTMKVSPHTHTHKCTQSSMPFFAGIKAISMSKNVSLWINIYLPWLCASVSWIFELQKSILSFVIDGNITYLFWALYSLHTGTGEEEKWIILCIIFSLKAHSLESTRKYLQWNGIIFPVHFFPF